MVQRLVGILSLITLSGCGIINQYQDAGIEATCEQWDYVYASNFDTIDTVNQVFELNTRRNAYCKGIDPIELRLR